MKRISMLLAALSLAIGSYYFLSPAAGCGYGVQVPDDPAAVQKMIATYRDAGPGGLSALLRFYDRSPDPKLIPIIDAVAGQRGAVTSRLFWYTDLAKASAAASAEHKPILYLRLLGKLTDEYSCANSRFFRTVLYSNANVSKMLRERYILVWVSERPVPVVTIDYGDGRVLKRTITGNSIHYILSAQGQVIDALPGLYDPRTFMMILNDGATVAASGELAPEAHAKYLATSELTLRTAWQQDVARTTLTLRNGLRIEPAAKNPAAGAAMMRAASKTAVERPLIAKITPAPIPMENLAGSINDPSWQKIAELHLADATLDASSIAVIRGQNPQAYTEPGALEKTLTKFQQNIALDTVHNNYQLRRQILSWLQQSPGKVTVEDLNRRVYAELFLTPRTDPWLGLVPDATYSALCNDGCVALK